MIWLLMHVSLLSLPPSLSPSLPPPCPQPAVQSSVVATSADIDSRSETIERQSTDTRDKDRYRRRFGQSVTCCLELKIGFISFKLLLF